MFKPKTILLMVMVVAVAMFTSGCVKFKTGEDTSSIDGGVFKTSNRGNIWQQKVLIPTTKGRPGNFAGADAASLAIDPSDHKAIYFGSVASGLWYTYDGGDNWQKAAPLGDSTISAVAVDPLEKCTIYAAFSNKAHKSSDCNRTWSQVYYDDDPKTAINTMAIDHFDSSIIYIGVSRGDVIRSSDKGGGWQVIKKFDGKINKIVVDPHDSRIIYALVEKKGIFRSSDSGKSWVDLNKVLNELKLGLDVRDLAVLKSEPAMIFLATGYGLLKSSDRGETWERIELISPEKQGIINALAINPQNAQEIYYVTNTTFYRSLDGGQTWAPKKLPTTRAGWKLLIDPEEPNVVYMGVRSTKK